MEIVETNRLLMRRLMPEDYKVMAAWDMDERVYKYLMGSACKTVEEPLAWLPKKDPNSRTNILMLVTAKDDKALMNHAVKVYGARRFEGECAKENVGSASVMKKLGLKFDHSSSYTKNDGSVTFESEVYTLYIG